MLRAGKVQMMIVKGTVLIISGRSGGFGLWPCQKPTVYMSHCVANPSQSKETTRALNKTVAKEIRNLSARRMRQSKRVKGIVTIIGMAKKMIFSIKSKFCPIVYIRSTASRRNCDGYVVNVLIKNTPNRPSSGDS